MLLPFTDRLVITHKFDAEMAFLADDHYSRQTHGSPQFMPPGETLIIRNVEGTVLFGWSYQLHRRDGQRGVNCTIFRNESKRLSSDVILECEAFAVTKWGKRRFFTYIDASKTKRKSRNLKRWPPGYCFLKAGWATVRNESGEPYTSASGKHLLEKLT